MTKLHALVRTFRRSEAGQDLAEYCLITALIALAACAIFVKVSGGMQGIWGSASTTLAVSAQQAGSPASGSGDARPSPASGGPDRPVK